LNKITFALPRFSMKTGTSCANWISRSSEC